MLLHSTNVAEQVIGLDGSMINSLEALGDNVDAIQEAMINQ